MMVDNFRRRVVLGITFLVLGAATLIFILYWLSGNLDAEVAQIVTNRELIQSHSQLIESLVNFKTIESDVAKYKKALDTLLPPKDDLVNFSKWLDGLSRVHNVSESFSFQGEAVPASDNQAGYINFVLDAKGVYGDLVNFLKDVELKAPRYLVSFNDFDFKRDGDVYHIAVHGRIFFQ